MQQNPVKIPTIGYGSTFLPDGTKVTMKTPAITESVATDYLRSAVAKFEKTINQSVKVPLTQNQFDALVCFCYNVGSGNFLSSTLLKVLNLGHYEEVPAQLMRWNKAKGIVLAGLTRRRQAESALFQS
jgi:lysozyme